MPVLSLLAPVLPGGWLLQAALGGALLHIKGSPKEFAVRVATLSHFGPLAAPGCSWRWFSSFSCLTPNHHENWSQKLDSSIFGLWPPKLGLGRQSGHFDDFWFQFCQFCHFCAPVLPVLSLLASVLPVLLLSGPVLPVLPLSWPVLPLSGPSFASSATFSPQFCHFIPGCSRPCVSS